MLEALRSRRAHQIWLPALRERKPDVFEGNPKCVLTGGTLQQLTAAACGVVNKVCRCPPTQRAVSPAQRSFPVVEVHELVHLCGSILSRSQRLTLGPLPHAAHAGPHWGQQALQEAPLRALSTSAQLPCTDVHSPAKPSATRLGVLGMHADDRVSCWRCRPPPAGLDPPARSPRLMTRH